LEAEVIPQRGLQGRADDPRRADPVPVLRLDHRHHGVGERFGGLALSDQIAHFFVAISSHDSFPVVMGVYSAILGLFIPSSGGKWLLEAPYIMQAAIELKVHLGWTVNVYNAAEALPNLINPFWMLPLLGILSMKARDIVGYTFLQLLLHLPVVLFMLWLFALTLEYRPPVFP